MKNWLKKRVQKWLEIEPTRRIDVSQLSGQISSLQIAAGAIVPQHLSPRLTAPGGPLHQPEGVRFRVDRSGPTPVVVPDR